MRTVFPFNVYILFSVFLTLGFTGYSLATTPLQEQKDDVENVGENQNDKAYFHTTEATKELCRQYFRPGGKHEHATDVKFFETSIDLECFDELPTTVKKLTLEQILLKYSEDDTQRFWLNSLQKIANRLPTLQSLTIIGLNQSDCVRESKEDYQKRYPDRWQEFYREPKETYLGREEVEIISQKFDSLEELSITGVPIGPDGANAIAFGKLKSLKNLSLDNNHIGPEGAMAIAGAVVSRTASVEASKESFRVGGK